MNQETLRTALIFILLGFVLVRNLRGFLLFLQPGKVRSRVVGDGVVTSDPAVRLMARDVEDLGFRPVGTVEERRPLTPRLERFVFAHPEQGDFAVITQMGREAGLHYLTKLGDGRHVVTADHRWPSADGAFVTGGLPGASAEEVHAAHRRRAGGPGDRSELDIQSYALAAERLHAKGPGKSELRRRSMRGFLFASAAILWSAMTAWRLFFDAQP